MASRPENMWSLRWSWLLPAAGLLLAFHFSPFCVALDRAFYDAASRHPLKAPPLPANSALVLVDEQTMTAMSAQGVRWPFPRRIFAQLFLALHQAGAKRVVADFTFLEESDAVDDQVLANVTAAIPSLVLARTVDRPPVFWAGDFTAIHSAFFPTPRTGLVEFRPDGDGIVRDYSLPDSLAVAALGPPKTGGGLLRWHGGLREIAARGVPVLSAAPFIVAGKPGLAQLLASSPDLAFEPMAQALATLPPFPDKFTGDVRGRVVFVGTNASGTFDVKPMPVGKVEPGVLLHWTAWTNLVAGGFITPLPRGVSLALAALASAALLALASRRPGITVPLWSAIGFCAGLLPAAYAGLSAGWFLSPATPVGAAGLTLLGVVAENFFAERRRKREIQTMFGAYVDPDVVARLVRDPASIRLGGERREATVFFSDLVGFTELSEKLRDQPERMVEVVNSYLEETSECLHRHGAYVDKYIGDAVMAVFGVPAALPDHALAACRAALDARRTLVGINARYAATGVKLEMRIGLNTGEMIVGNLGSSRKKNYTVMGDAVNLASRLEGANKEFDTHILLGETTARAVAGRMATRPLSRLRVKGKLVAIEVHELLGRPEELTAAQREFLEAYLAGYAHYAGRNFAAAAADFDRALAVISDDTVTRELLRQAQYYATQPPPAGWEPILTLDSK